MDQFREHPMPTGCALWNERLSDGVFGSDGSTKVAFALQKKRLGMAIHLTNSGAAVPVGKLPDTGGKNALHLLFDVDMHNHLVYGDLDDTATTQWIGLFDKLLAAGVSMAEQDDEGNTPLHLAVSMSTLEKRTLTALGGRGLSSVCDIKNNAEETALDTMCGHVYNPVIVMGSSNSTVRDSPLDLLDTFLSLFSPNLSTVDANGHTVLDRALFPNLRMDDKQEHVTTYDAQGEEILAYDPATSLEVASTLLSRGNTANINLGQLFQEALGARNADACCLLAKHGACAGLDWRRLVYLDVANGGRMIDCLEECCDDDDAQEMLRTWYAIEYGDFDAEDFDAQDSEVGEEDNTSSGDNGDDGDEDNRDNGDDGDDDDDDWEMLSRNGIEEMLSRDLVNMEDDELDEIEEMATPSHDPRPVVYMEDEETLSDELNLITMMENGNTQIPQNADVDMDMDEDTTEKEEAVLSAQYLAAVAYAM